MALENLFIRSQRFIGGIRLDAVLSEGHESTVTISRSPVEFGADVSDHAIIEPKKLTITADVSDTPLGIAAFTQIIDDITGLFGSATSGNTTRSALAYNAIVQLQEQLGVLTVQTGLRSYDNMMIVGIATVRDRKTSRIVRLVISLEELLIRMTQVIQLSPETLEEGKIRNQASSAVESGRKSTATPEESVRSSTIQKIRGWLND